MSLPVFGDRVQETFTTTGTGTISLGGAVTGYQAFSAILADGKTCYYGMTDGINWEIGLGTYASSGNTLARTTVIASSNANAAVNWAAGTKSVWLDLPATLLGVGQVLATNTNDNASAGNVGEFASSAVLTASGVSLSTGVAANVTSISLTAGDWDVQGLVNFTGANSTVLSDISVGINTTSATLPGAPSVSNPGNVTFVWTPYSSFAVAPNSFSIPNTRVSISTTTVVYLVALANFSTSTCKAFGQINARRRR